MDAQLYHGVSNMELTPHECLFAAMIPLAIRDATQRKNEPLRAEACTFLWTVAPTIAERSGVPKRACPHCATQL